MEKPSFFLRVTLQHAKGGHGTPAPPSPHVTHHPQRERHRREQGEGDHQPPKEPGTASSAVFCVWRHKVTKFGKVRTAGQTSCITPLQGMGMGESVHGFSALSTVWRILNTGAMTPASSWFICNICGEIHSLERNYLDNSFYPKNCWIFLNIPV